MAEAVPRTLRLTAEDIDSVRNDLQQALPAAKFLSDKHVESLCRKFCTTPQALEDIDLEILAEESDPVPKAFLSLIKGYKQRHAKRQKVSPDLSAIILKRLIGAVPTSLPTADALRGYLSRVQHPLPVLSRVYDKLSYFAGADQLVSICEEQENAEIVIILSQRVIEDFNTSGTEELTAHGVSQMLFEALRQIDKRVEAGLQLGMVYDKYSSTKGTVSVPNTVSSRPDGTGVVNHTLILTGEEKAEDGKLVEAKQDIQTKFSQQFSQLHYGLLYYIIAYAAAGKHIQFHALLTRSAQLIPISDVINYDSPQGRARLLLLVINLYGLLLKMKATLPEVHGALEMFKILKRPNGVTIEARQYSIHKTVQGASEQFRIAGTSFISVSAAYRAAQGTRYLVQAVEGPILCAATDQYKVVVQPMGCPAIVRSEEELQKLTHDVLHGLSHLHSEDICHRDIRLPNIIVVKNSNGTVRYILIDLESSAFSGAPLPQVPFDAWDDSTLVNGEYVAESDLYQLAKLVKDLAKQAELTLSAEGREFVKEMSLKKRTAQSLLTDRWVACKCDQGVAFSQEGC